MDELARYNRERWEELARAGVAYSRPWLDLTPETARERVDTEGMLGDVTGLRVLCLAGGGGQQSAAFALLGAQVTVLDFSETQLERDREAARHYGRTVETAQGDMRDLSRFESRSFDLVWHAHSIVFVPDVKTVFAQVAAVLRRGGVYRLSCHNPYVHGTDETSWNGEGYLLTRPYVDGEEVVFEDEDWDFADADGAAQKVRGPHEFRHALSTLVNGLIENGFRIQGLWEDDTGDIDAPPGSWAHFCAIAPPWLVLLARWD